MQWNIYLGIKHICMMFMFAYYLFGMYIKTLIADFWLILQTVMTVLHYVYIREYESAYIYILYRYIYIYLSPSGCSSTH